jgi:hypothetical protein
MSSQYYYSQQQYSPIVQNSVLNGSPTFTPASSTTSSVSSYSHHNPRIRYYLSKSFDIEDDLEFCPDIPDNNCQQIKKFNPYTATTFSPSQESVSPRVHTPRIKKALEIINPKLRASPAN